MGFTNCRLTIFRPKFRIVYDNKSFTCFRVFNFRNALHYHWIGNNYQMGHLLWLPNIDFNVAHNIFGSLLYCGYNFFLIRTSKHTRKNGFLFA